MLQIQTYYLSQRGEREEDRERTNREIMEKKKKKLFTISLLSLFYSLNMDNFICTAHSTSEISSLEQMQP